MHCPLITAHFPANFCHCFNTNHPTQGHPSHRFRQAVWKTLNPALHRPQRETKGTKCSGTLPDPHSHVEERPFQGRVQGTRNDRALAPVVVLARSPQRRVKRFWRNRALAPVALHPTGTLNSLTKTHTLPHLAPTVREPDSYGHTRDASRNPPRLESGDS